MERGCPPNTWRVCIIYRGRLAIQSLTKVKSQQPLTSSGNMQRGRETVMIYAVARMLILYAYTIVYISFTSHNTKDLTDTMQWVSWGETQTYIPDCMRVGRMMQVEVCMPMRPGGAQSGQRGNNPIMVHKGCALEYHKLPSPPSLPDGRVWELTVLIPKMSGGR